MYGHHKPAKIMKMKEPDRTLAKNNIENAKIFCEHFQRLFNSTNNSHYDHTVLNKITPILTSKTIGKTPIIKDIQAVLSQIQCKNILVKMASQWKFLKIYKAQYKTPS